MNPYNWAVLKLAHRGYWFQVNGETIKAEYHGPGKPDLAEVKPLFEVIKAHKPEVLAYLTLLSEKIQNHPGEPAPREHIWTCFECPMHEHDQINPPEGWGHCRLRNLGCYGLRPVCEEFPNK